MMYKNNYEITSLDKQIILFSKNWFGNYLDANKIEVGDIEILKHMISKYTGTEVKYLATHNVYYWVSNLYSYLSDSGEFPELSTKSLLDRFTRVLNPFYNSSHTQEEEIILTLLGGISMTDAKGLDALGIDLGEPDFSQLKGLRHIKNPFELLCNVDHNEEYIMFNIPHYKTDFIYVDGSGQVSCVDGRIIKDYDKEDVIEVDFKDIHNIRYVKKTELSN